MYTPYDRHCAVSELIGKTVETITGMDAGDDEINFKCSDGSVYTMWHAQDCCESVYLADVEGDVSDLIGSPIVVAEEVSSDGAPAPAGGWNESYTWTFYRIATAKGFVVLRWFGESNGYYSEGVDFAKVS